MQQPTRFYSDGTHVVFEPRGIERARLRFALSDIQEVIDHCMGRYDWRSQEMTDLRTTRDNLLAKWEHLTGQEDSN